MFLFGENMIQGIRVGFQTSNNIYAFLWDEDGKICYPTGEVFETFGTNSRAASDYAITLTEVAAGFYTGTFPSFVTKGNYDVTWKIRVGSTPANSDYPGGGPVEIRWSGSAITADPETNAVNICNRAIAIIGGGRDLVRITALGDGTDTSDNCELLYTPARKEVLKRMQPQECLYYADLGDESSFSGEKAEWTYVFDLPDDYLHLVKQTNERYHRMEYRCEVIQNQLFTNTLTNEDGDSAYIRYVKNETDASIFSEETAKAIATLLASHLAPFEVSGDWGWKRRIDLKEEFETIVLPDAMGVNRSVQYHDERPRETDYGWLGGRSDYD